MTPLYVTLHRWAAEPFVWGLSDCMTAIADWVLEMDGFDPCADLRGTYGNPETCPLGRRYRHEVADLCAERFSPLERVGTAGPGDIALLQLPGHPYLSGALRLHGREWAMKSEERGVLTTRFGKPRAIWKTGYAS